MSDMIFDEWVIGGPSHGRMRHAVMRRAAGLPNSYTCSSLCGARGGDGVVRGSNQIYDPTLISDPCTDCARKWAALYAPQIEGWTKACASCQTDKAITQFHTDARTKDGLAKTCFECLTAARQAVRSAERLLEHAAQNDLRQARSTVTAQKRIAALQTFQDSALTPTFRCSAGHVLTPTMTTEFSEHSGIDYDEAAWTCACGTRVIRERNDQTSLRMVFDAVHALEDLAAAAAAGPTYIDMSGVSV